MSRHALLRPIEVTADLSVESNGAPALHLSAEGTVMRAAVPDLGAALALARQARIGSIAKRRSIAKFGELLTPAGLIAEIQVGNHLVARVGAGVRGGRLSNLVGLPGVELRPLGILRALIAR